MQLTALGLGLLLLLGSYGNAAARDPYASWENRCEECHGDADEFARKYLWVVDGQLQGQHHIDNLDMFLGNHYLPSHEIATITDMLQAQANDMDRFGHECGGCHKGVEEFVRASINTWGDEPSGVESGIAISEFLLSHQNLQASDAEFFKRLIDRVVSQISKR